MTARKRSAQGTVPCADVHEVCLVTEKEEETLFKTGNSQKTTPSNASSSIHSLLNKLKNVKCAQGTVPPVHLMSIDVLYAVNAKKEATALIEPELSSQSDVSLTASKISISDLLDYVNRD